MFRLGGFLAQRGQPGDAEQALKHYTRELELSESLLKRNPDSALAARDVALSLEKLGDFLAQRRQPGDAEQALKHYTRCLELRESLLQRNPDSFLDARYVSVSLEKLGYFLAQRGQPGDAEQALKHYTRCLELRESLLKSNPDSAQAARDVSLSMFRLGGFLAHRGQPGDAEQALKHYTRELELSESLLKRNPDSAQAARDVMVSHWNLGDYKLKMIEIEPAITHFGQAIQVLDGMIAKGANADQARREKAILLARVRHGESLRLATADWDTLLKSAPAVLPELLRLRVAVMARRGRLAEIAQAGAKLRELNPKTGENLYNAACAYALCAGLVVRERKEPAQLQAADRQEYVGLALACLKEAIAAGYSNFGHMREDTDLVALRGLAEFEQLFPKRGSQ
jgi:tetratricopeptide (TPR) repeat protein